MYDSRQPCEGSQASQGAVSMYLRPRSIFLQADIFLDNLGNVSHSEKVFHNTKHCREKYIIMACASNMPENENFLDRTEIFIQKIIVYHFTVIMNNLLLAGGDAGQTITAARHSPHTSTAAKKHVNELYVFIDVAQTAAHDSGSGVYSVRSPGKCWVACS